MMWREVGQGATIDGLFLGELRKRCALNQAKFAQQQKAPRGALSTSSLVLICKTYFRYCNQKTRQYFRALSFA